MNYEGEDWSKYEAAILVEQASQVENNRLTIFKVSPLPSFLKAFASGDCTPQTSYVICPLFKDDGLLAERAQAAADEHSALPGGSCGSAAGGAAGPAPDRLGGRGHRRRRGHRREALVDDHHAHHCPRGEINLPIGTLGHATYPSSYR